FRDGPQRGEAGEEEGRGDHPAEYARAFPPCARDREARYWLPFRNGTRNDRTPGTIPKRRSFLEEAVDMAWLGQKPDPEPARTAPQPQALAPAPASQTQTATPSIPRETRERTEVRNVANIGKSIYVKGELSGNEDLIIDGRVEGKIVLAGHAVTIGQSGTVTAEVQAKAVVVNGQVKGNITAEDRVEVAATGSMQG